MGIYIYLYNLTPLKIEMILQRPKRKNAYLHSDESTSG